MKVLSGMAPGQTTGFVEGPLRLAGFDWTKPDWTVPDFRTLSPRDRTPAANIPYRGSEGPSHLPIPLVRSEHHAASSI